MGGWGVWRAGVAVAALVAAAALWVRPPAEAAPRQAWPVVAATQVAAGFSQITSIVAPGDGTGRLLVTERSGRVRFVRSGGPVVPDFLDIRGRVTASGGEQGLAAIAFPPGYATSGRFYVSYTRLADGAVVLSRFRLLIGDPGQADPASEEVLLVVLKPTAPIIGSCTLAGYRNHNGGALLFSPDDGLLYFGIGDGGCFNDPGGRAQQRTPAAGDPGNQRLLGKLLRLDVEGPPDAGRAYRIPPDNPRLAGHPAPAAAFIDEVWALGLRNAWRGSFDRVTRQLYLGDVGEGTWEEINVQQRGQGGQNYGWGCYEATTRLNNPGCGPAWDTSFAGNLTFPAAQWNRGGSGAAVVSGYAYRGPGNATMQGVLFAADFVRRQLWGVQRTAAGGWEQTSLIDNLGFQPSTFGEDECGYLYLADYGGGRLFQLNEAGVPAGACGSIQQRIPVIFRSSAGGW